MIHEKFLEAGHQMYSESIYELYGTSQEYVDEWARINSDTVTDDDDDDDAKARAEDLRVGKEKRDVLRDSLRSLPALAIIVCREEY
ncbi:hypothetical protein V1521DRAFT_447132 [Lipomyces starkeyi]